MFDQRLITRLSRLFKHPLRIPSALRLFFRRIFFFIPSFTPFRSLFTTYRATPPARPPTINRSKKKALLIGICGSRKAPKKQPTEDKEESVEFQSRHRLSLTSKFSYFADVYGYASDNIIILLDDEHPDHIQPSRVNILNAIDDLVRDAKPGDRFCFHFAGHAGQTPTNDPGEEDGMDEFIVASDGKKILDDILHRRLVKPLPPNSFLTAVMDSCHSCSLLDLKHHRCNRVFVPWISKGKRRTKTLWYETVRKQAMWMSAHLRNTIMGTAHLPSIGSLVGSELANHAPKPPSPLSILTDTTSAREDNKFVESPIREFASPKDRFCDGFKCRQSCSMDEAILSADVVCLSSSQDSQKTWEDAKGVSMSQILIELLRKDPNRTLAQVMKHITFTIHDSYVTLHTEAREHRKRKASYLAKKAKEDNFNSTILPMHHVDGRPTVSFEKPPVRRPAKKKKSLSLEMTNFQDPELSSLFPLDMARKWTM
ncbi:hypothetical protein BDN70DRAFT_930793 [Pholiota conissans]|uniref:Peptidase C14 caspase domain-containing protein n=1 Tax=Pholiota conissans TaxID=109636 RepID=A0A9P5Z666_9AGAR|nr:hypothetical protein BDN70DRAFT_930793 [Pholiota conissans]